MQSMNIGLREGFDLAQRIGAILVGSEDLGVLDTYNAERRKEWKQMMGIEGEVVPLPVADPWIASIAHRMMTCFPESGSNLERLAGQLDLQIRQL